MKKRIILSTLLLAAFALAIFAFSSNKMSSKKSVDLASSELSSSESIASEEENGPELPEIMFDVGTRFNAIKKSKLQQATSFDDFIGKEHQDRIVTYKSLSVYELVDGIKTKWNLTSLSGDFTAAQLDYLQEREYNEDILIWATYSEKWPETGVVEDSYWTPHLTIVPEKQARYAPGKEALMKHLKVHSAELATELPDRLQPGRVHFTIGIDGTIKQLEIKSSSGHSDLDNRMLHLISETPGKWVPAENQEGEKVEQELVLFFGSMGC